MWYAYRRYYIFQLCDTLPMRNWYYWDYEMIDKLSSGCDTLPMRNWYYCSMKIHLYHFYKVIPYLWGIDTYKAIGAAAGLACDTLPMRNWYIISSSHSSLSFISDTLPMRNWYLYLFCCNASITFVIPYLWGIDTKSGHKFQCQEHIFRDTLPMRNWYVKSKVLFLLWWIYFPWYLTYEELIHWPQSISDR